MTTLTNAELAILSLVTEKPRHGYEMEQVIEGRGMREWTEVGFSSIYYLLKKLEKDGLVESQLEQAERGPARKVYHATQAGYAALHQGTLDALAALPHPTSPLQLGLSNLPILSPEEAISALQTHRQALIERIEGVQATWDRQRPLPYFVDAMFDHALTMANAELAWIETFIKQVEKQNG
jgi:DNA-binding PadR family transcriptional regulator